MMNSHNMKLKTAALLLSPFLLTTGFDVSAGGNMSTNPEHLVCQYIGSSAPCWVATEVNCSYIGPPKTGIAIGGPSSVTYPPEPQRCTGGSSGGGGVAPPFVPPASVILAATVTTYYHNDALGSPVSATDDSGEIVWTEEYRPYGDRILKTDEGTNDLWYTGKPHEEEFGLSYYGARWYDPDTGRFTGVDPAPVKAENLYSFNRYMYANDNPYRNLDPDGRWTIRAIKVLTNRRTKATTMVYHISFTAGGYVGASAQYAPNKISSTIKAVNRWLDAGGEIVDSVAGHDVGPIGDNQFSDEAAFYAQAYDSDIREAFMNKTKLKDGTGYFTGFSHTKDPDAPDNIRNIVSSIWDSMSDDAKEIYKRNGLGSVGDIIKAANDHAVSDVGTAVWGMDSDKR